MTEPMRLMLPALLGLGLALGGCASSTSGFADEGQDDRTLEQNAVKSMMTALGAIDPKDRPIEYKARSPLVVPPKRDLPAPQTVDPTAANPAFPRNPEDVDYERSLAAEKGGPDPSRPWTPDQLARYRMSSATPDKPRLQYDDNAARPLKPDQMRGQSQMSQNALQELQRPSERTSLVQPPVEYRKPSDKAPIVPEEPKSSWKPSWLNW